MYVLAVQGPRVYTLIQGYMHDIVQGKGLIPPRSCCLLCGFRAPRGTSPALV